MLRVMIADDEAPARKRLKKMLQPLVNDGRVKIVAESSDGVETLEHLKAHPVDLLLLDIRMPGLDGFEVLERIPPDNHPVVVFTTAYDDYALRAFDANAVDYLLKPIARERLSESVVRAERMMQIPETRRDENERLTRLLDWIDAQTVTPAADKEEEVDSEYMRQISIPYRDRILVVPVTRLVCAEINEGITRLCILVEGTEAAGKTRIRQHIVNYTLEQLEENLNPDLFMRVHRSAIVQLDQIQEMIPWFSGRYKLVLTGNHEVIASRERSKMLKDRLMVDLKK